MRQGAFIMIMEEKNASMYMHIYIEGEIDGK
jgi:hypothetical protein